MIVDSYTQTREEADEEVRRRRQDPAFTGYITKVEDSPYGGFRVHSVSAEWIVDGLVNGPAVLPGLDVVLGPARR